MNLNQRVEVFSLNKYINKHRNTEFKAYIKEAYDEDAPVLCIKDEETNSHIELCLLRNKFISAKNYNKENKKTGESTGNFHISLNFDDILHEIEKYDIETIKSIIIFGHICEAVCKAGISISLILANINLLEQFINDSLKYYMYQIEKFSFKKFESLIKVEEGKKEDYDIGNIIKEFIILETDEKRDLRCSCILCITENCIYIKSDKINQTLILLPPIIHYIDNSLIIIYIMKAISWILLVFNNFYVGEDGSFCNFKCNFECNFDPNYLYNCSVLNPHNFSIPEELIEKNNYTTNISTNPYI